MLLLLALLVVATSIKNKSISPAAAYGPMLLLETKKTATMTILVVTILVAATNKLEDQKDVFLLASHCV